MLQVCLTVMANLNVPRANSCNFSFAGFLADSLFLTLLKWFGPYCFLLYAGIAFAGGAFSFMYVPETMGRTLTDVQAILSRGSKRIVEPPEPALPSREAELSTQAASHLAAAGGMHMLNSMLLDARHMTQGCARMLLQS